jgi:hypothetical protein
LSTLQSKIGVPCNSSDPKTFKTFLRGRSRVGAGCLLHQTGTATRVELVRNSLLTYMREFKFTLITSTK